MPLRGGACMSMSQNRITFEKNELFCKAALGLVMIMMIAIPFAAKRHSDPGGACRRSVRGGGG